MVSAPFCLGKPRCLDITNRKDTESNFPVDQKKASGEGWDPRKSMLICEMRKVWYGCGIVTAISKSDESGS